MRTRRSYITAFQIDEPQRTPATVRFPDELELSDLRARLRMRVARDAAGYVPRSGVSSGAQTPASARSVDGTAGKQ
jgi:hypothetical protein